MEDRKMKKCSCEPSMQRNAAFCRPDEKNITQRRKDAKETIQTQMEILCVFAPLRDPFLFFCFLVRNLPVTLLVFYDIALRNRAPPCCALAGLYSICVQVQGLAPLAIDCRRSAAHRTTRFPRNRCTTEGSSRKGAKTQRIQIDFPQFPLRLCAFA